MAMSDNHLTAFSAALAFSFHDSAAQQKCVGIVVDSNDHAIAAVEYYVCFAKEYDVSVSCARKTSGDQRVDFSHGGRVAIFIRNTVQSQIRGFSLDAIYLPYDIRDDFDRMIDIIPSLATSADGRIVTY